MIFRLALLVCSALLWSSTWSSSHTIYRICGEQLNEVLDAYCPGGVPSIVPKRKDPTHETAFIPLEEIFNKRSLLRQRRYSLDIIYAADECCKRGCTRNELLGYCGPVRAAAK